MRAERPTQTFAITPEQYAELEKEAAAQGVPILGDSGTASKFGVQVQWHYSESILNIQVVSVPFFLNPETVEAKIAELVNGVVNQGKTTGP